MRSRRRFTSHLLPWGKRPSPAFEAQASCTPPGRTCPRRCAACSTASNGWAPDWGCPAWGSPLRCPRPTSCRTRSEEHTSELQSHVNLVCRLLLEKKKLHFIPLVFPTHALALLA